MFRTIAVLASLVSAFAFAPMGRVAKSSVMKMQFEETIGAQPPLGFWDPLGLLNDADQDRFDRLREVETKHGRISMLAILGHLVTTAGYRLPTSLTPGFDLSGTKAGLAGLAELPSNVIFGTVLIVALIEGGYTARKDEKIESIRLGPRDHRQEALYRAEQWPRCPDGYPRPDGAREARQQPLHHQLPVGLPCAIQLSDCSTAVVTCYPMSPL